MRVRGRHHRLPGRVTSLTMACLFSIRPWGSPTVWAKALNPGSQVPWWKKMVGFTVTFVLTMFLPSRSERAFRWNFSYHPILCISRVADSRICCWILQAFINIPGSAAHLATELQAITRDISYIRILYPYTVYIYTHIQYIYIHILYTISLGDPWSGGPVPRSQLEVVVVEPQRGTENYYAMRCLDGWHSKIHLEPSI